MYCTKCGKEMPDDAVICTGCGCLLNKEAKKLISENVYLNSPRVAQDECYENRSKSIAKIFFIISLALIGLAKFFMLYNRIFMLIISILALGSAITGFVFSRKQTSEALKLVSAMLLAEAIVPFLEVLWRWVII